MSEQTLFEFATPAPEQRPMTTAGFHLLCYRGGTRAEHYDAGHPWYFLLGGSPPPAAAMKAREAYVEKKLRIDRKLIPIEERIRRARAELKRLTDRYQELITRGPSSIKPEPWHDQDGGRMLTWAGSCAASVAHITWVKGELRGLAKLAGHKVPAYTETNDE